MLTKKCTGKIPDALLFLPSHAASVYRNYRTIYEYILNTTVLEIIQNTQYLLFSFSPTSGVHTSLQPSSLMPSTIYGANLLTILS